MKRIFAVVLCLAFLVFPVKTQALSVNAKAAILINSDTGEVIYAHNADEKLPMASTTKIMTALLLCEHGSFDKEITVTAEMLRVEGSSMGLLAGDRVTLHDLLYGLMLASGNDAANVVAFTLGGTVNGFVKLMNNKAKELGLISTNFVTPSGLDAEGHYTTARDLAELARYALKNKEFAKAASSKSEVLNYGNPPYRRSLTNHNKLLKTFEGAIGVKTGFTKKSGRCLVSAAEEDGKRVIAVTLNDPDDWNDHRNMLRYGLNSLQTVTLETENYTVPVVGSETESITVNAEPFTVSYLDNSDISYTAILPKFIYAPVSEGEEIGRIIYKKGDAVICEQSLCSDTAVPMSKAKDSFLKLITENIKYIILGIWEK